MFILRQGNIISSFAKNREELEKLRERVPNGIIEETDIEYSYINGHWLNEAEKEQKEQDRINHLTCTALDLVTMIKSLGVTDEIILQWLQANPSAQLQLTLCKDVYCGVVRQMCPIKITDDITLTDEMVVKFYTDRIKTEDNKTCVSDVD